MRPRAIGKAVEFLIGGDVADESVVFGSRIEQDNGVARVEVLVHCEGESWWIPMQTIQPHTSDLPSCIRWKV